MPKSISATRPGKPKYPKPHADYPLTAHVGGGQWCKKVRGRIWYFGPLSDPQSALEKWLAQKDDLLAGRKPRTLGGEGPSVRDLVNRFLTHKQRQVDAGEINSRTWADYFATCGRVIAAFGATRLASDVAADDFEALRASLAKSFGPVRLSNEVQRVRSLFKYGHDAGVFAAPVRFGQSFSKPTKVVLRKHHNAMGLRMFTADELRKIVDAADQPLKSMVLLAANTGFGNTDLSELPIAAIDLDGGWVSFPRPKAGIARRVPLWGETVAALREWLANRPKPKDEADAHLCYVTKYGRRFVKTNDKGHPADALGQEFSKLIKTLGLHRAGLGFYLTKRRLQFDGARRFDYFSRLCCRCESGRQQPS